MALTYGFCLGSEGTKNPASDFAGAFNSVFGDGVSGLEVSPAGLMSLSVGEGFAIAGGWWILLDDVETITAQAADNTYDRWDCVVARVDQTAKTVSVAVAAGKPGENPEKYSPVRNGNVYELPLYHVRVRLGSTAISADDIQKAEEAVPLKSMDAVASEVVEIYEYLNSGIEERVEEIAQQADEIIAEADKTVDKIADAIAAAEVTKPVGEVEFLRKDPTPAKEWLKCDGSPVPPEYQQVQELVGASTPTFPFIPPKFGAWMYAGTPGEDIRVYGIEADFENSVFTRLASSVGKEAGADFDGVRAFGGRRRCNLTNDGVVTAYYGDPAYTETGRLTQAVTVGGTEYPVGTPVQVMVEQPRFYYKVIPLKLEKIADGEGYHLRKGCYFVSDNPRPGFKLHPAFITNGREVDKIYFSAYEGCIFDTSADSYILDDAQIADFEADMLSSIANAKPCSGQSQQLTRANARKLAQNRGAGWQLDYAATVSVSQLLMVVEYASFNMQVEIGEGVVRKPSDTSGNQSDNTGTTSSLGNTSGSVINLNDKSVVSYRGEENRWGNILKFVDGINVENKTFYALYVANSDFADDMTTGSYEKVSFSLKKSNDYISAFGYDENFDWLFVPTEADGTPSRPTGDSVYLNVYENIDTVVAEGGAWYHGAPAGPFFFRTVATYNSHSRDLSARPVYIPQVGKSA